jgi:lauroyl/myristoyl acyltransferase
MGNNSFKAIINDPIIPQVTNNRTYDIQQLTQSVMTSLEHLVLRHPEQWFVFRPLWQDKNQ